VKLSLGHRSQCLFRTLFLGVALLLVAVACTASGSAPVTSTSVDVTVSTPMASESTISRNNDDSAPSAEPTAYEVALKRFTASSQRTIEDRPDEIDGPMVKFLYVVPSFATDRQRDINGEIARFVFHSNEWLASQNGGFGVAVDTFDGALDIPYVEIDTTVEEWESWFAESLGPAAERLRAQGWNIPKISASNDEHLYYVIWEAFAGAYLKTGSSGGGCRGVVDGNNAGYWMAGYAVANPGDVPCSMDSGGRFPFGSSPRDQQSWFYGRDPSFVDHSLQWMRYLPGCGYPQSPRDGESFVVPGTSITEIRGGFIRDLLEPEDPVAMRLEDASPEAFPGLDVRHNTYFHITTDRLAKSGCNSDAGKSPMWSDTPFYQASPTVPRRTVVDRPDDVVGPQIRAVYVRAKGAPDRALDTGLEIAAVMRDMDAYLRSQTGGTGIRLDTFNGHIDIGYLPLPFTTTEMVEQGWCDGERCPSDIDFGRMLRQAGYDQPDKWYVFFYDGGVEPAGLCGGAGRGRTALINLADFSVGRCDIPWRANQLDTWSLGLLVLHEVIHSLGAVCPAAPTSDGDMHSTVTNDLLYARADGPGISLDAAGNSYWGPGAPSGCDISRHPLFTTDPNALPSDGTQLEDVPINSFDVAPSARTFWWQPAKGVPGSSGRVGIEAAIPPAQSPGGSRQMVCPDLSGGSAATFTGMVQGVVLAGTAEFAVGLVWANDPSRCLVNSTLIDAAGRFALALPAGSLRTAPWREGGGYCVVLDINKDGVFDSINEPVACVSDVNRGATVYLPLAAG